MEKKCKICGNFFVPKKPHYDTCPECFFSVSLHKSSSLPSELLLNSYYDSNGILLKEIFIDIPEQIAQKLSEEGIKINQLRDFYSMISQARRTAMLKGINSARPILWQCITKLKYQLKREIIPPTFVDFMKHHLSLAEKDEKQLEAFYQHFDSIVCYFPKQG